MYEYKVIPAPLRTAKLKGLKTPAERFAHMLEAAVNTEATGGWEYLRSETLPCEERKGLTGTARSFQSVLVFRRATGTGDTTRSDLPYHAVADDAEPYLAEEPALDDTSDDRTAEPEQAPRLSLVATRADALRPDAPRADSLRPDARAEPVGRQEPVLRPGAALRSTQPERAEPLLRTRALDEDGTQG